MSNPCDCSVCHSEGYDHADDCPFHPANLDRAVMLEQLEVRSEPRRAGKATRRAAELDAAMMDDFHEAIRPFIEEAMKLDRDMIERACEASIQGGEHGVLVLRSGQAGPVVSAEVDESVPYGHIHERALE